MSDSKFPQVSRTLPRLLADVNVCWMVLILLMFDSARLFRKPLVTVRPKCKNYNWYIYNAHIPVFDFLCVLLVLRLGPSLSFRLFFFFFSSFCGQQNSLSDKYFLTPGLVLLGLGDPFVYLIIFFFQLYFRILTTCHRVFVPVMIFFSHIDYKLLGRLVIFFKVSYRLQISGILFVCLSDPFLIISRVPIITGTRVVLRCLILGKKKIWKRDR